MPKLARFRLWLARWLTAKDGYRVVRDTPAALLPSRVEALRVRLASSGHLGHRYHVRRNLEGDVTRLADLVEAL